MNTLPLRLSPGTDLRRALEEAAKSNGGSAFVVSGIGSLQGAKLRFADANSDTQLDGPFELLSLSGSISPGGAHLHMAVANAQGEVLGGHVCYGNTIRTTAEVLLINLPDWALGREVDDTTGFKELVVRRHAGDNTKHIRVYIDRSPGDVYAFASNPANLPLWAAGLATSEVKEVEGEWVTHAPFGMVKIRFAAANEFGILDHDVELESGLVFHNPMRVVPNGNGSEVTFTLMKTPEMTDAQFAADAEAVAADLRTLKMRLEGQKHD